MTLLSVVFVLTAGQAGKPSAPASAPASQPVTAATTAASQPAPPRAPPPSAGDDALIEDLDFIEFLLMNEDAPWLTE